jgi:hypothetical protein
VRVYLIFWGSAWSGNPTPSATSITAAVSAILTGNYLMLMGQYRGVGDGALLGAVLSTVSSPNNNFSNTDVANQVIGLINGGVAPKPVANSQVLYVVVMPKGVGSNQPNVIGEHFMFTFTDPSNGQQTSSPIAWVTNDGTLDGVTTIFSHELAEACTDPAGQSIQFNAPGICMANPNSWCEVGDLCNGLRGQIDGITVQQEWSELAGACMVPNVQDNWRWCHKCQGLFFGGNPGSHCPAGGAHDSAGSGDYFLVLNTDGAFGQANWRWCHKCQGMFFGGNPGSHCPAGGAHDSAGSGNYTLLIGPVAPPRQEGWRWCHKCQGFFFAPNPGSHCPAGGAHDAAGSGAYGVILGDPNPPGQHNWRWCHKCQGMFFGGNPGSHCPAGGAHDSAGSGDYAMGLGIPNVFGQENWRWCHKCQGMFFGGNPGSVCPAGGAHDQAGSGHYNVVLGGPTSLRQDNWRWCHKCQGMFFGGNPGSHCPAGGAHDSAGSGDYGLVLR